MSVSQPAQRKPKARIISVTDISTSNKAETLKPAPTQQPPQPLKPSTAAVIPSLYASAEDSIHSLDDELGRIIPPYWTDEESTDLLETLFHTYDVSFLRKEGEVLYNSVMLSYPHMGAGERLQWGLLKKAIETVDTNRDLLHFFFLIAFVDIKPHIQRFQAQCPFERIAPFLFHLQNSVKQMLYGAPKSHTQAALRNPNHQEYPTVTHWTWKMKAMYLKHIDDYGEARKHWMTQLRPSLQHSS